MRPQRWQAEAAPQPTSILPQSPAAELAYALNKAGVSTLVMAPELKGTSFVDLAESIRWVRISSVQDGLTSAAAYSRPPKSAPRVRAQCCVLLHSPMPPAPAGVQGQDPAAAAQGGVGP